MHLISLHFLKDRLCFVKQELNLGSWHGRKCRDISLIFRVSGLPDTIFTNESRLKEKNRKYRLISAIYIGDISPIYRLWPDISESKSVKVATMQKNKKNKKKIILADISSQNADFLRNLKKKNNI